MAISEGLKIGLNQIRETSIENNTLYHNYIDEITDTTDIGSFASPILEVPNLANEFMSMLVQRIVYTQVYTKLYRNPLRVLEGDRIPLGSIGQEIYVNPAKARQFNVDDFAGLLAKYEADVKVQYMHLNSDLQYCVTITRAKLKDAFVSWATLENFIDGLTQSLYNGAYIDQYNLTKGLVSSAYASNQVNVEVITAPTTEEQAKQFLTTARGMYLAMQTPTTKFNAWRQVGGYGRDILTWSNAEDIVFLLRGDIASYLDVNVLAQAFNIDRSLLLGNVIYVNDFDQYDNQGNKIFDGSNIIGMMADKSWFRIKEQETTMDEFYNANNRTWQYYLNVVRMYQYSLFANAVVFATQAPAITITGVSVPQSAFNVTVGESQTFSYTTTPVTGNTPELTLQQTDSTIAQVTIDNNNKKITMTGKKAGTNSVIIKGTNVPDTRFSVTVTASESANALSDETATTLEDNATTTVRQPKTPKS